MSEETLLNTGTPDNTPADNPADNPPADNPPVDNTPADNPPADNPPVEWGSEDWQNTKYTSADEQAKAYNELAKKFGGFNGAPEDGEYTFDFGEDSLFGFDEGDEMLTNFNSFARDINMNQDSYQKLMTFYKEGVERMYNDMTPNRDEEMKSLGADAEPLINQLANYGKENLNEAEMKTLESLATTADGVRLLAKLVGNSTAEPKFGDNEDKSPLGGPISRADLEAMMKDPLYRERGQAGDEHRKKVEQGFQRLNK